MRARATRWFLAGFAVLVLGQAFLAFMGAGDRFCLGHNGWNSSAYLQSARNTDRWGMDVALFPVQYYTGTAPPAIDAGYTHHPLGMHLHNVLSLELFGDTEGSIRAVPAFFGVLALIALILVARRLYGETTALVAGAIYIASPINGIFTNMSNHENGFIFWTFLFGLAYLRFIEARAPLAPSTRTAPTFVNTVDNISNDAPGPLANGTAALTRGPWRRWYVAMLVTFFWAAMWDWPSYYCALIFASHWLAVVIAKYRRNPAGDPTTGARRRRILPDLGLLSGFSALVLGLFVGHFVMVRAIVGSTSELQGVFEARQAVSPGAIAHHLVVVPLLMFSVPILVVGFGWFFQRAWLAVRGRFARRDIIAFTFAIAGLLHYYIFRGTAVIHEYWGWTLVPFVAIACAHVLVQSTRRVHAWLARRLADRTASWRRVAAIASGAALTALIVGPLTERLFDLVPRGRAVGGSMWFVEPTRVRMDHYVSGRDLANFMTDVKGMTTRADGVMVDPAYRNIPGYEPRVEITLDRETVFKTWSGGKPPKIEGVTGGWVYLTLRKHVPERKLTQLASEHPVYLVDDFVMVDLRPVGEGQTLGQAGGTIRIFANEPTERSVWTWYWKGPWAEAVAPVEQAEAEAKVAAAVQALRRPN